jgi:hypothetical protein
MRSTTVADAIADQAAALQVAPSWPTIACNFVTRGAVSHARLSAKEHQSPLGKAACRLGHRRSDRRSDRAAGRNQPWQHSDPLPAPDRARGWQGGLDARCEGETDSGRRGSNSRPLPMGAGGDRLQLPSANNPAYRARCSGHPASPLTPSATACQDKSRTVESPSPLRPRASLARAPAMAGPMAGGACRRRR